MIPYIGDFPASSTIRFMWNTSGSNGASITRATDGSIRIYKNNSATQRTSSNGITDTEDFDSLTGVHHLQIDTSDNSDAGFYAAGNDYFVVLTASTIDSQAVNAALFGFSIENRTPRANVMQWNGANIATPDSSGHPKVTIKSGTGTGELSLASGVVQVGGVKFKKNTAYTNFTFLMVDATDGVTPETGLTVTATRRIDNGSFSSCANSVSEVSNGCYSIDLAASDMNGDAITLRFTATGARTVIFHIPTQTA